MKANVPERIWINQSDLPKLSGVIDKNSIEYIRKDTFVDEACEFMRNNIQLTIYHDNTWRKRDEFIEAFKNYMKRE